MRRLTLKVYTRGEMALADRILAIRQAFGSKSLPEASWRQLDALPKEKTTKMNMEVHQLHHQSLHLWLQHLWFGLAAG